MLTAEKNKIVENLQQELSKLGRKNQVMTDEVINQSLSALENMSIPNAKSEEYKYCNPESILRKDFKELNGVFSDKFEIPEFYNDKCCLIFVNGSYVRNLKLPKEINIEILNKNNTSYRLLDLKKDTFLAINSAYADSGINIQFPKNYSAKEPIYFLHFYTGSGNRLTNPYLKISMEENSQVEICELFFNQSAHGNYFENRVSEIFLKNNSVLNHYRCINNGINASFILSEFVSVKKSANYQSFVIGLQNKLMRHNLNIALDDSETQTNLFGLSLSKGDGITDHHTCIEHQHPHCESNELYKGIAYDKSNLIFNGKIHVFRDAQKTNAYQSSKNIQISDDASVNAKPQLEIYANDVKCSHGTSTGKVNEDALFYLKARGIGEESARKLLLAAFAGEIIEKIDNEEIQQLFASEVEKELM